MLVLRIEFKDEILYYGVVNYNRSPQILEEIEKLKHIFLVKKGIEINLD